MAIQIREAVTREDRERCYRLRYQVYVEEMHRVQEFADHERRMTEEPYDRYAHLLMAEDEDRLVGTMRLNMRRDGPLECEELYALDRFGPFFPDSVSMITKFVIEPDYRQRGVAGRLAIAAYQFGRRNGIKLNFIDCYPHLVQLYQQMGYRIYKSNIKHPDYGSVIPMVLLLEDIEYLEQIHSPFLRYARGLPNSRDAREYFDKHFPEYASVQPLFAEHQDLMETLAVEMGRAPEQCLGFLEGFTTEESQALIRNLAVLKYQPGEYVFKQGDESLGMFCIIKGQVEVLLNSGANAKTIAILNQGDIFGEMGFVAKTKRTASIRVREATDLLVLAPTDFQKVIKVTPELGVRFLTNLFTTVVERYINVVSR
jgi:GNAT superfamily N-acetyltransferase